ncbi:hypothetical protein [Streptomyces murinus]
MGVLEFISSLKWPIVVLVVFLAAITKLRRSPEARASLGAWLRTRNLRFRIAGQEFESTLADTLDNMTTAASGDGQLAGYAPLPARSLADGEERALHQTLPADELTDLRRSAVEAVMRNAARWGWEMAQIGHQSPPNPQVRWTDDGTPEILFGAGTLRPDAREWYRTIRS